VPPGTPAIPAPSPPESPGFGASVGEAVWRGGKSAPDALKSYELRER